MNIKSSQVMLTIGVFLMSVTNTSAAKTMSVRVTNINTEKPGNIIAMLFAMEGFPKQHDQALTLKKQEINAKETVFDFTINVEKFAIKILHDENSDGKTTKNWTGIIPAEGLGFSNGATLSWHGPPSFKKAHLTLAQSVDEIVIPIIYP
ncbi:DUF2141 domain-containing protein [Pseudoalteromonas sp. MMG005]|uniref:DUF2141 domain-containing protein n=1 Tax=Pseudoalteromonas sp. MMG005 TaxID=2822682 RepID=UPI001B3A5076|nr:DUF2141 domain-containing protein [Pseudoalteromonas sp. MMG005]MBQ4845987.1 DUF2141 domain-containing protein [Pseudoalteromonas sp. MMG005]